MSLGSAPTAMRALQCGMHVSTQEVFVMQRALIVALLAGAAGAANADVVAYWAFPGTTPPSSSNYIIGWPIAADLKANTGPATLDTDALKYDGSPAPTAVQQGAGQLFAGSALSAQPTFAAGSALSFRNLNIVGGAQNLTEGKSIILTFDASNYQNLRLIFDERYTAQGPQIIDVLTSSDGVSYSNAGAFVVDRDSTFRTRNVDLTGNTTLNNDNQVFVKITMRSFTGTGNARFDNITITGDLIPTPGALALTGIAGLMVARRRRK